MATIAEKVAALEEAMATGTRSVLYDGHRVEYATQQELERALAYFKQQQRAAAGQRSVKTSVGAYYRD